MNKNGKKEKISFERKSSGAKEEESQIVAKQFRGVELFGTKKDICKVSKTSNYKHSY